MFADAMDAAQNWLEGLFNLKLRRDLRSGA